MNLSMRYRTGTRDEVLYKMATFAIRDRKAYLEATEGCEFGSFPESRQEAKDLIKDFQRIQRSIKP